MHLVLVQRLFNYYNEGYNVLAMDLRGHGKARKLYRMGYHDVKDLVKWLEYIISKEKKKLKYYYTVVYGSCNCYDSIFTG